MAGSGPDWINELLKKEGSRLGGQSCQYFIRFIGKDGYITSRDVIAALIANGLDIKDKPTSQRDQKKVQDAFNHWQDECGLPMTHISRILGFTAGDNVPAEVLSGYENRQAVT